MQPDGTFRFQGISRGSYNLLAIAGPQPGDSLTSHPLFGRTRVEVSGNLDDISVTLREGRAVSFVLRQAEQQLEGKSCPAGATLTLVPAEDWGFLVSRRVQVNAGKPETLRGLAPGLYTVEFERTERSCYFAGGRYLDLSGISTPALVNVKIVPAASLRGRLTGLGKAQPSDFAVLLLSSEPVSGQVLQVAVPDEEGRFAFSDLRPGNYRISARPASVESRARWVPDPALMLEVKLAAGQLTDLELPVSTGNRP